MIEKYSNTKHASIALATGGAMWGLYWIPVRFFQSLDLPGAWPGLVMYLAALIVLCPIVFRQRAAIASKIPALLQSGVFTGAAFGLFTLSLIHTDVVRSILLFYLTPVWGTILGALFLHDPLTRRRVLALICGLAGLIVVLGLDHGLPWPRNGGDWMALASGVAWAIGSMGLYRQKDTPISGQIFAFILGATLLSIISLLLPNGSGSTIPENLLTPPLLALAALSTAYMLPMIFLTIWPSTILTPARVGMLLMTEVVVGVISAALFSGEVFGLTEFFGAILIFGAALIDVTAPPNTQPQTS